ncbi:MAG TPA: PEP-CTERM sorting domain-containing protein [Verrucomicrobiae bacterium]|jgi:hypothetical protein|nr:PEP-CTERM sorting domain-containing protein [Verrucomicrobiae bacterium]
MIGKSPAHGHACPERLVTALKSALALTFSLVVCATSHAQLTTVAYDGFNYSSGSLVGANGGTGWTSSWINDYTSGATFQVSGTGMSYSGLATSGGSLVWGSGGNGISEDSRSLPLMDSGVVYLQFLSQFGSTSGGGTPNIRLLNSGSLTGGFGGNGGTHGSVMSILDASLSAAANGSSSSSASLSALTFVIARIDYQNDSTSLWVNPNATTFDYQNPTSPNATYAGLAPKFNTIAIDSRSPANVDEITVMTVPEPASASLLALGAFLLYRRRTAKSQRTE